MHFGVVENNDDSNHPDGYKLSRCQVRVFGKHTENKSDINNIEYLSTEDLPWYEVLLPVTTAGINYNIETPFIKKGSFVSVEYIDKDEQHGIIIGVVLRQPKEVPDFTKGFSDPDQAYPAESNLNKSPLYPYSTGDVNDIIQGKISDVATSTLGFSEPATPYAPIYTHNKVISTNNHLIELDDTPGKERVHIYHKSGTFSEIHPSGKKVTKVKGAQYHIIIDDDNTKVNGKSNLDVTGDINIKSGGNVNITATTNASLIATGNVVFTAGGAITGTAVGAVNLIGSAVTISNAAGSAVIAVDSSGAIDIN